MKVMKEAEEPKHWPKVSIITVNYNQTRVTMDLLASLRKVTYPNYEVIVVDNASPDGDARRILKEHPEVRLLESGENLGFAGGNNLGIRASSGEYIMLLNNDTEVDPGFLEPMVNKCLEDPGIGAVSPKIYFHHTPGMLQYTGLTAMSKLTIRNKGLGFGQMDHGQFDRDSETSFAHGAAMMVPRKVIREVGLMAEVFFLYYEEMDWGQRIRDAGYRIFYVHDAVVYHKESVSTGKESPLKTYYMNRARLIYLRRNVRGASCLPAILFQCFIIIPKNILQYLFSGKFGLLRAYLRALGWNVSRASGKSIFHNPSLNK